METELIIYFYIFIAGLISFFSISIIPLVSIYFSYLVGNGKDVDCCGNIIYNEKKILQNTAILIFGIVLSFFILGLSFTTTGDIYFDGQDRIAQFGGFVMTALGILQLVNIKSKTLQKRNQIRYDNINITSITSFIVGFTFCFAWTPSLAPTLSTILNLIVTLEQNILGHYTIIVYSLGFIIPLMILGMSSTIFLNIFKSKQTFLKYSVKVSGAFLILIGVLTLTGYTSELSKYFIS